MKEIDNKIKKKVNAYGNNKTFAKIDNISKIKEGKLPRQDFKTRNVCNVSSMYN